MKNGVLFDSIYRLREQVNERKLILKNSVEKCCLDSVTTINKNIEFLNDLIVKNKYCIDLTEAMLIHNHKREIMMLSKCVVFKLFFKFLNYISDLF